MHNFIPVSAASADLASFTKSHQQQLLYRLKVVSILVILFYPYFLYADLVLFRSVQMGFRIGLYVGHNLSFLMSVAFLFISRIFKKNPAAAASRWPGIIIHAYAALYVGIGVLGSINSQRLTGNIDTYVIILISVAVVLPLHPKRFLPIVAVNHIAFLVLLANVSPDRYSMVSKQINTTATAFIAFFIAYFFYTFRRKDFLASRRLSESEEHFRKLFAVNPFPLILTRIRDDRIMRINEKAMDFYQLPLDSPIVESAAITYSNEDKRLILNELKRNGTIKNRISEVRISGRASKWVMTNYELLEHGSETFLLTAVTDITELKKIEDKLVKHASTDALTGVMNRRKGLEMLGAELSRPSGSSDSGSDERSSDFSLCFVDINNLKKVNDQYGHAEGDELITRTCEVLRGYLSEEDYIFRYGGDEFVIVFHTDKASSHTVLEQVNQELHRINRSRVKPYKLAVSYGICSFRPGMDATPDELIERADQEMYKDKHLYHMKSR